MSLHQATILMQEINPVLLEYKKGNRQQQLFYLAFLKDIGKIMSDYYNRAKDENVKLEIIKFLKKLHSYIIDYKLPNN